MASEQQWTGLTATRAAAWLQMYLGDDGLDGDIAVQHEHACDALQAAGQDHAVLVQSAMIGKALAGLYSATAGRPQRLQKYWQQTGAAVVQPPGGHHDSRARVALQHL